MIFDAADQARTAPHAETRIELCGDLRVVIRGRDLTRRIPRGKGQSLLAYLVLNRGRPVGRDELVEALWPEQPPRDPVAVLSSVLTRVRNVVGPSAIPRHTQLVINLDRGAIIDVEDAASRGRSARRRSHRVSTSVLC